MAQGDKRTSVNGEPEIELADGSWSTDWRSLNAAVQSFADANTPYVWAIPNASSVESVSFVLGDRRAGQEDRRSALLSFTPAQLKETAAPWTHTVEGDQDVLSALDVPQFYNWTIKSRVIANDVLEITFNSVHRDNADAGAPDLGVDTFGGIFSLSVRYASAPTLSSVTTARFQPDHDYIAGDPILEPNPLDDFAIYTWTADEDFTSGPDPDFDGTGFTVQEKAPQTIGTEIDITGGNSTPKTFAGNSIAKGLDILNREEAVVRKFETTAPATQWGTDVANGQVRTVISSIDGEEYQVRDGATVTLQTDPSLNIVEWIRTADIAPPEWNFTLADLQAITFEALVGKTGQIAIVVDTEETVQYHMTATAASVAPRKFYEPANYAVGQEGIGGWIVISPETSETAAQFEVFTGTDTTPKLHQSNLLNDDIEFLARKNALPNYHGGAANNYGTGAGRQEYTFAKGNVYQAIVDAVDPLADPSGTSAGLKALREANWRQVSGTVHLNVNPQPVPDATLFHRFATDQFQAGDEITIIVLRGTEEFQLNTIYIQDNDIKVFNRTDINGNPIEWRVSTNPDAINMKAQSGGGTQVVTAVRVRR